MNAIRIGLLATLVRAIHIEIDPGPMEENATVPAPRGLAGGGIGGRQWAVCDGKGDGGGRDG